MALHYSTLRLSLKHLFNLGFFLGALVAFVDQAGATWADKRQLQSRTQDCAFTLSSSGGIACPAGQLTDGQIRLNGSESIATFFIADGKITDSAGRGCIITGECFDLFNLHLRGQATTASRLRRLTSMKQRLQ